MFFRVPTIAELLCSCEYSTHWWVSILIIIICYEGGGPGHKENKKLY